MNPLNEIGKYSSSTGWVPVAESKFHGELKEKLCQQAEEGTQTGTKATAAVTGPKITSASRVRIITQKMR